MSEIESIVKEIIIDKLGVKESKVTMDASFQTDLGADDMDVVEVLMEIEKKFGIAIPGNIIEDIITVGDAVAYIISHCDNASMYDNSEFRDQVYYGTKGIEQKVFDIIVEKLGVVESEVTKNASFTNDLGADSLDAVELIMEFEKEFGLFIPDDEAGNISTVGDAITYIINHCENVSNYQYIKKYDDSDQNLMLTESEEEYLNNLKDIMSDGANLSALELKLLDRLRESLDISEERAQELKDYLLHPQLTDKEQQYFDSVKESLEDGVELSSRERKMLDRIRESLGISEVRAREIEGMISKPQLTEDEQEYVDMYCEYAVNGEITEKDRRKLDKYASILGISPKRAKELEKL